MASAWGNSWLNAWVAGSWEARGPQPAVAPADGGVRRLFRPAQVVPLRFNVRLQSRVAFRLGVRSAITVYPSPSLDDLRIVADTADLRDIAELIEMQRLHAMLSRNLDVEWCDG